MVSTSFPSSSIWSPYISLFFSLLYPHSIKSSMVSGGLDVHLHFTPWSMPCSAHSSTDMVTKGPSCECFCISWCGLVGRTMESSKTEIGWVSIERLRLVMSFILFLAQLVSFLLKYFFLSCSSMYTMLQAIRRHLWWIWLMSKSKFCVII